MDDSPAVYDVPIGRGRSRWRVQGRDVFDQAHGCLGIREPGGAEGGARGKRHQTQALNGHEGTRFWIKD